MDRPLRRSTRRPGGRPSSGSRHSTSESEPRTNSMPCSSKRDTECLPEIYREMLTEATSSAPERPQKRPMTRRYRADGRNSNQPGSLEKPQLSALPETPLSVSKSVNDDRSSVHVLTNDYRQSQEEQCSTTKSKSLPIPESPKPMRQDLESDPQECDDDGLDFEDVSLPLPVVQTMIRDSDDESSDSDSDEEEAVINFDNIDVENLAHAADPPGLTNIELNLSAQQQATLASPSPLEQKNKRKPLTKEQKQHRLEAHRMHILCLIWHCSLRNHWCNDPKVQATLKKLLTQRTRDYLCPKKKMLPFAQTESIKRGLRMAGEMWKINYSVTERGMKRALWATSPEDLATYEPYDDLETCPRKDDFQDAAKTMSGSRDMGAQLYCAFLRAAGIRTRLVCSLQVLPFRSGGLSMVTTKPNISKAELRRQEMQEKKRRAMELYKQPDPTPPMGHRRRVLASTTVSSPSPISHSIAGPSSTVDTSHLKELRESAHPVYWVEVLDKASQRWYPADPIVTKTFARTKPLEPPLSDRDNLLTYVVAFEDDGTFRDVTCRYAKAFKSKTRKLRIEHGMPGGQAWWQKVIKHYTDPDGLDPLDFAENVELQDYLAREPMPKNISDFRGHPDYVLPRHLKRNQVLKPGSQVCGTVAPASKAPVERVYARADVRVVHSNDKWFRLGRQVRPGERPAKMLVRRTQKNRNFDSNDDMPEVDTYTPAYTEEQTDVFQHPPVVNGRVPRNKFGNLEIYVPGMIPNGGAYLAHNKAVKAAYLLGIDYTPVVSGFEFRGRHGTAVMKGAVVAAEHAEAMYAVLAGFDDMQASVLEDRKRRLVLKAWTRFLKGLRIRAEIWKDVDEEKERRDAQNRIEDRKREEERAKKKAEVSQRATELESMECYRTEDLSDQEYTIEDDDDGEAEEDLGGGFLVE